MPAARENDLIAWLAKQPLPAGAETTVRLGIGDDMAMLHRPGDDLLVTTDLLLDGVHFDRRTDSLGRIGRKAIACSLSDCAAMAVRPLAATVSVALPPGWSLEDTQRLDTGMRSIADTFDCPIVGGDTTAWDQRLAIDVTMLAVPHPGQRPIRRDGAEVGDAIYVTGPLGGSILGKHLDFIPRVTEARQLAEQFGDALHAMLDISDGLAIDLDRMCTASGVGACLERRAIERVVSAAARELAKRDGTLAIDHALSDGEDFELLLTASPATDPDSVTGVTLLRIGFVQKSNIEMADAAGLRTTISPGGFEHRT